MSSIPLLPALIVEFFGSAAAILLSFYAVRYSLALVRLQPNNFIWGFLFYFCSTMAAFALSRGVGHIVRITLVYTDHNDLWKQLSPFSGGFNTLLIVSVAAVTIYYHKGLAAYKAIRSEARKLAEANTKLAASAKQLQTLNTHLEEIVEERTRNLSESEKKFRNFFENSKDIVYFCDKNGQITNINSSGKLLLGFENNPNVINFHELFNDKEALQSYLDGLAEKGFVSDLEMECTGRNGTTRHILLTANALYDKDRSLIGCEGIGKDMTRIKNMTEQLINHEKMASVGQMAAGVAHEINTPLGIILGYTQLMMDDFDENSETHSSLQIMERQIQACRRIVADLLKFSRQTESTKAAIDLNDIVLNVLSVTEHSLNIQNITVNRQLAPDLPRVTGDAEKLQQVMINLFNNAQQAMESGGEIVIFTAAEKNLVRLTVQDSGTGIDSTIKNKIFDPFFTTKDVGKGTGLGLSVTYGIIKEHNGRIEVESPVLDRGSQRELQGSAFHIWLPVTPETAESQKEQD
ncbi:two-component system sensor histidine kinase NtrB [Desulforhopalus singaporensis]|uniref:histidine kinase n=1 Tax=Desulforhopalus singaporensis TaxID=91360 RepID=A0A1H0QDP2_9BACT|nr:ATP-binding protein [Desulforhopalus singaporensis]SDP15175.1 PAS domain S-box-containing protein [Desulforhopalus singaporensis]